MIVTEIIGNLTADPELYEREYTNKETGEIIKTKVCNFSVGANEGFGERRLTQFFKVSAWRRLGEVSAAYLKKGNKVFVRGPVILKNYVDKTNAMRSALEIRADYIEFFDNKTRLTVTENGIVEIPETPDEEEIAPY